MKVAVIGERCLDVFVKGVCGRICPEGPVPVLDVFRHTEDTWHNQQGMACNVSQNVRGMGAEAFGMHHDCGTKTRYIDVVSGQLLLRVDEPDLPEPIGIEALVEFISKAQECDAVIVSDYDKGFLDEEDISFIAQEVSVPTFLDTKKPLSLELCGDFHMVKVNEKEWKQSPVYHGDNLLITLGAKGCAYKKQLYAPPEVSEVRSVSGAGDTFIAALAVRYAATGDDESAIRYALKCAGEVVKHPGTTVYEETCKKELHSSRGPVDS